MSDNNMDPPTQKAFEEWIWDGVERRRNERIGSGIAETPEQFLARMQGCSFMFRNQREEVRKAFRKWSLPFIHIGERKDPDGTPVHYAVEPGDGALDVSYPEKKANPSDERERLPGSILALNEHIVPVIDNEPPSYRANRKSNHIKEESHETTNSDDFDVNKFQVFQQLGVLRYYAAPDFDERKNDPRLLQGPWRSTGFAVVIDITNGTAGDVFIICDMHPRDESTGERGSRNRVEDNFFWGRLPFESHKSTPYMYAKIADSTKQLGRDYQFQLGQPFCNRPVEIVYVRQAADGALLYRETK